jgi:hypothetical protein
MQINSTLCGSDTTLVPKEVPAAASDIAEDTNLQEVFVSKRSKSPYLEFIAGQLARARLGSGTSDRTRFFNERASV